MKKVITIVMIIIMLSASVCFADSGSYSPALQMSMDAFIQRYNNLGSALGSPLIALSNPKWYSEKNYNYCSFAADEDKDVMIFMYTSDNAGETTSAGLDEIHIRIISSKDFLAFLTVAERCARIFAPDMITISTAPFVIMETIEFYYENRLNGRKGEYSYRQLSVDSNICCRFYEKGIEYYFEIYLEDNL